MKGWRVIIVLLSVVILLAVFLGVKIINNTPEKQKQEIMNNYSINSNTIKESNTTNEDEATELLKQYFQGRENYYSRQEKIDKYIEIFSEISMYVIIICSYIIFYKMGMDSDLIKKTVIASVAMFLPLIGLIAMIVWLVLYIKLLLQFGKTLGISTIMCFIPFIIEWKIGDYFGKGIIFKLGLIFLPIIFFPILAFTAKA